MKKSAVSLWMLPGFAISLSLTCSLSAWAQIGPTPDAEVEAIILDPYSPTTIYAGTDDGMWKTTDGGQRWSLINDGIIGTTYSNLAIDPTDTNIVYMGTQGDGLFKTINGGESWSYSAGAYHPVVKSISIDPTYPNVVYMGAFRGIYRSYDRGGSWTELPYQYGISEGVLAILNDPTSFSTIYIGTNRDGVLKSTSSGSSWFSTNLPDWIVGALAMDPRNHNTIFASTGVGGIAHIFKSTNGGSSWTQVLEIDPGGGTSIVFDSANPDTMYAGFYYGGVYKSTDGGNSWSASSTGLLNPNVTSMGVDAVNGIVYAATYGNGIFVSYDGGQTWF